MRTSISRKPTAAVARLSRVRLALSALAALFFAVGNTVALEDSPAKATRVDSSRKTASSKESRKTPLRREIPTPPRFPNRDLPTEPHNSFFPDQNAPDDAKDFQKSIAEVLSRLSVPYPARVAHFGWLAQDPNWQKFGVRMSGWGGQIVEAKELPGNGWIAKARVRPYLVAAGRSEVYDYVDEVYRYENGKLILIETDAKIAKPEKQIFALH